MNSRSYDVSLTTDGSRPDTTANDSTSDGSNSGNEDTDTTEKRLSWKIKIFFSFGHIYNDLCASIWFSYTLIFFQMQFKGTTAGILILLGQVADALATPFVGFQSDRNNTNNWLCRYGKRKTWHLLGTILVTLSFPLIFNKCIACQNAPEIGQIVYYGVFIVLFQFGWAAVQVGHVSLITDLSTNSKERVELNAYRQASTVGASICVYTIAWLALSREGDSSIRKEDSAVFTNVVYIICAIGLVFSVLFHLFVWEPKSSESGSAPQSLYGSSDDLINKSHYRRRVCSISSVYECGAQNESAKSYGTSDSTPNGLVCKDNPENGAIKSVCHYKWSDWLKCVNFYKVAFIYMVSRLFVNLTQVYTPLFLQRTLDLRKTSIATIPFVTYISGFVWSLICKYISAKTGPKILLLLGCVFGLGSCIWNDFGSIDNESFKQWQVYGTALLFGIGGTTMLIASLALTSDLIGTNTTSSAFVFGTMSFFDKVLNGGVVVILEQINPYKDADEHVSIPFYQHIVVFVSGATCIFTILGIVTIIRTNFNSSRRRSSPNSKRCSESSADNVKY